MKGIDCQLARRNVVYVYCAVVAVGFDCRYKIMCLIKWPLQYGIAGDINRSQSTVVLCI